jgi:uncharacterized protein YfbU (UPF0304 family)
MQSIRVTRLENALYLAAMKLKEYGEYKKRHKDTLFLYYEKLTAIIRKGYTVEEDELILQKRFEELCSIHVSIIEFLDKVKVKYPDMKEFIDVEKELIIRRIEDNLPTNSVKDKLLEEVKWQVNLKKIEWRASC